MFTINWTAHFYDNTKMIPKNQWLVEMDACINFRLYHKLICTLNYIKFESPFKQRIIW